MFISAVFFSPETGASDYTKGIMVVNESQYGKGSGSLNYLLPESKTDNWEYRVFRQANPGKELGCTSSYGAYHDGKLYVVSKLAKDPESAVTGGVLTVMDGETLKWKGQIDELDPSGQRACGRAFLGVDDTKGYVSSSNGIWIVNLSTLEVTGKIDGSENPYGVDEKPVGDPTGTLYFGQCGSMVLCGGRVFAAHQSKGVLVIDPSEDRIENVITMDFVGDRAGVGSIVKAHDGNIWASVTQNIDGDGCMCNSILRIDPISLETTVVTLPEGIYPPSGSWASWTADTFCASPRENLLLWTGGSNSWFANQLVFKYDIDNNTFERLIDFEDDEDQWKVCGPSLRVSPIDGSIYMTLFKDVVSTQYMVRSYDIKGNIIRDYPMERGYWFAGMILFPAADLAGVEVVGTDYGKHSHEIKVKYHEGRLTVTIPGRNGLGDAMVYDVAGRGITSFTVSDGMVSVPVSLSPGAYILSLEGACSKFIVR